jgi:hypothetical protein
MLFQKANHLSVSVSGGSVFEIKETMKETGQVNLTDETFDPRHGFTQQTTQKRSTDFLSGFQLVCAIQ